MGTKPDYQTTNGYRYALSAHTIGMGDCVRSRTIWSYQLSKINFSALSTAADFKAAAESLYKRNMSAKKDMQSALLCAFKHMNEHGDWTSTVKPLLDVGVSFGKNLNVALMEYVLKYTWLALDGKAWAKDKAKAMDLEGAALKDWWTMEKEAKAVPYDFQKALATLFDGIAKELAKPDTALDRNTVFSGIETKLRDIVPVEDQIVTLFERLSSDHDRNAILTTFVNIMTPANAVIPADEVVEPEAETAAA